MDIRKRATANRRALSRNPYRGRGIVQGLTPDGDPVQIYWLMGRSESSQNRVLEKVPDMPGWLRTRVADKSGFTGDPSLLIYTAMAEKLGMYVVSNGAQTDAVMQDGISALTGIDYWKYEPDGPNFTPRITGVTDYVPNAVFGTHLIILRKSPFGEGCDCLSYDYGEDVPGYGHYIATYQGDGDPLPSFHGEPLIMPIRGSDPAEIAEMYWSLLNSDYRVALAVKVIRPDPSSEIAIINRHKIN